MVCVAMSLFLIVIPPPRGIAFKGKPQAKHFFPYRVLRFRALSDIFIQFVLILSVALIKPVALRPNTEYTDHSGNLPAS
jgi:hypothetical protein